MGDALADLDMSDEGLFCLVLKPGYLWVIGLIVPCPELVATTGQGELWGFPGT